MGRAAKQKAARRQARTTGVQLEELDYLRLTSARDKIDSVMLRGQAAIRAAVEAADKDVAAARKDFVARLAVVAKRYQFNPNIDHDFDDKRWLLIPRDGGPRT